MLVRKIKCPVCSANKVNEISTSYIYCDYCGSLMGYDIEMLQDEAKDVFSVQNLSKPLQQKFLQINQELAGVIKAKNKEKFIELQLQNTEIEFDLYQKRFSPKIKQSSYRKKYLDFYKLYWTERIENGYFEKNKETQEYFKKISSKVKTKYENGQNITTFDNEFIGFLDAAKDFVIKSIDETAKMDCIAYYPEGNTGVFKDILYKQGLSSMIQHFDEETIKKSLKHLGLQYEYIEIEDVQVTETTCVVCDTKINIPEGANSVVCENCGSFNELKNREIKCLGCGASFNPKETDTCPYCGAKTIKVGHTKEKPVQVPEKESITSKKESITNKNEPKQKKRGFFKKLFK